MAQQISQNMSVAALFDALHLRRWWDVKPSQTFNGSSEWGDDFPMSPNTPVGAIQGGKVVYVGQDPNHPGSSIGYIVQVEAADGTLTHYQHLRTPAVKQGDTVHAGQIVGASGGCPANGYGASGSCRYTDQWSTGPHIEVRRASRYNPSGGVWYQPWHNPAGDWQQLAGNPLGLLAKLPLPPIPGLPGQQTQAAANCTHSVSLPGGTSICLDPGLDLLIRAGLIIGGMVLVILAIVVFMAGNGTVRSAFDQAAGKAEGAASDAAMFA